MLTENNWLKYLHKRSNYICTTCFKQYSRQYHKTDINYNRKQAARYHFRKSAVIFSYGNSCVKCHEDDYYKLTIVYNNHDKKINNVYEWLYNNPIIKDGYQVLCHNCSKNKIYKDKYAFRDKKKVIDNYGGQCVECQEDKIEKLTLYSDINNTPIKCKNGIKFYRWLIKNKFPHNLKFQVLCFNCNYNKISLLKNISEIII